MTRIRVMDTTFEEGKYHGLLHQMSAVLFYSTLMLIIVFNRERLFESNDFALVTSILFSCLAIYALMHLYIWYLRYKIVRFVSFDGDNWIFSPYLGRDYQVNIRNIASIKKVSDTWLKKINPAFYKLDHDADDVDLTRSGILITLKSGKELILGPRLERYDEIESVLLGASKLDCTKKQVSNSQTKFKDTQVEDNSKLAIVIFWLWALILTIVINISIYSTMEQNSTSGFDVFSISIKDVFVIVVSNIFVLYAIISKYKSRSYWLLEINFVDDAIILTTVFGYQKCYKCTQISKIDNYLHADKFLQDKSEKKYMDYGFNLHFKNSECYRVRPSMSNLTELRKKLKEHGIQ